jgi:hypothetical protein
MSEENALTFADVTDSITDTMGELDGEAIAEIHNNVCSRKIRYVEDSIWEYTGEDDS